MIILDPLNQDDLDRILDIRLRSVQKRLSDRRIELEITSAARQLALAEAFASVYGPSPMKRVIQNLFLDPVALKILEGDFRESSLVVADVADCQMLFSATTCAQERSMHDTDEPAPA